MTVDVWKMSDEEIAFMNAGHEYDLYAANAARMDSLSAGIIIVHLVIFGNNRPQTFT